MMRKYAFYAEAARALRPSLREARLGEAGSGWPRVNRLLPGLVRIDRATNKAYRSWVNGAALDLGGDPDLFRHVAGTLGMSPTRLKTVIAALERGKRKRSWQKVEVALISWSRRGPPPGERTTPTPGHYYRIRWGDALESLVRAAYGSSSLAQARAVNCHPYNRRYWKEVSHPYTLSRYGDKFVSFFKRFSCDLVTLHKTALGVKAPTGKCYALLWLPYPHESDKWACKSTHKSLPRAL